MDARTALPAETGPSSVPRRDQLPRRGHQLVGGGMTHLLRLNERLLEREVPKGDELLDPRSLHWTAELEAHWTEIRDEVDTLVAGRVRLPQTAALAGFDQGNEGSWSSLTLCSYGRWIPATVDRCPRTAALVRDIPGLQVAGFSVLGPGAHLPRHRGPNRGALRYQIGLRVPGPPGSARLDVGRDTHVWNEGASLLFDHAVEHEAWNDGDADRYLLFIEVVWPLSGLTGVTNRATQKVFSLAARRVPVRAQELDLALNG